MEEITIRDLYILRGKLRSRMIILNKIKEKGHYKNSDHSRGVESFINNFLDSFCTEYGFNNRWNYTTNDGSEKNNHISWGVKGQMRKLVPELRVIIKQENMNKILTYEILCKLVTEYYDDYEKIGDIRNKRISNRPYDNTERLYPGHVKLQRLLKLEVNQGFVSFKHQFYCL